MSQHQTESDLEWNYRKGPSAEENSKMTTLMQEQEFRDMPSKRGPGEHRAKNVSTSEKSLDICLQNRETLIMEIHDLSVSRSGIHEVFSVHAIHCP